MKKYPMAGDLLREQNVELTSNPAGVDAAHRDAAVAKYAEFHAYDPKKLEYVPNATIPTHVYRAGVAKWVTYRSKKTDPSTGKRPSKPVDYIHEHDPGVELYLTKKTAYARERVAVPEEFQKATALAYLGINLGFAFTTVDGDDFEAISEAPAPELWATPDGRCLLVIQDRKHVIAMEWGGALGVFARGIDG